MPSSNRPHSVFTFLKPRPKKVVLFPEICRAKVFYHLPTRITEIVSEYIFFFQKKKERENTDTQTNKKEKKLKKINWL